MCECGLFFVGGPGRALLAEQWNARATAPQRDELVKAAKKVCAEWPDDWEYIDSLIEDLKKALSL